MISIKNNEGLVTITIERPKALNAINSSVMKGLNDWFSEDYKGISQLSGVIITGSGEKAFAAGADITEFMDLDVESGKAKSQYGHDTYFLIEKFHVPVIAAINGFALGGGLELAMACHIRIASNNAKFGQPEVNLGLIPGYGGSQRLPQIVGKGRALSLLLTADMIDAEEALKYGLITALENQEDLLTRANKILSKISTKGPLAISETIASVNAHYHETKNGFKYECETFGRLLHSEQCKEGVQAFLEKRKANFNR